MDPISKIFDGSIIKFRDRENAAEMLYSMLKNKLTKISSNEIVILGIPRGGIILGDIIATKFRYQFHIVIPRKLVAPNNKELSIGGIMKDNTLYLDTLIIKTLEITDEYLKTEKDIQLKEIKTREALFGQQIEGDRIRGKNIVLVDDGVATGTTLIVASRWIRKYKPKNLTIAIPVCPKPIIKVLSEEVDMVESIITPYSSNFNTIEGFYHNFEQLKNEKLTNILKKYRL
ncbi:MAG: phosphoribosyltransferase [Nitrososphaeraceae archaeon]